MKIFDHFRPITRANGIPIYFISLGDIQTIANAETELFHNFPGTLKEKLDTKLIGNDTLPLNISMKEILTSFHYKFAQQYLI